MPCSALRPRSATELIDASFQILRKIYPQCVTAMAAIFIPFIVLRIVLPESVAPLVNLVSQLFQPLALAAIILLVSNSYLGGEMKVSTAIGRVMSRFGTLMLVSFIQGFMFMLGLLLLIVPCLIAFAWTFAMPQAVMLEGMTASEAFWRSRDLAKGQVRRILLTAGLAFLLFFVFLAVLGAVLGLLLGMSSALATDVASEIVSILVYPLFAVVATLLYYDLRIRKEGFDLDVMTEELGAPQPALGHATVMTAKP